MLNMLILSAAEAADAVSSNFIGVQRPSNGFGALWLVPMVIRIRLVELQKWRKRERAVGDGNALDKASILPEAAAVCLVER